MIMRSFLQIGYWGLGLLTLLLLFLFWGNKQSEKRDAFSVIKQRFEQKNFQLEEHSYSTNTGKVYYVTAGNPSTKTLLLIHGSPGDWTAWERLLLKTSLLENYRIVVVDRPSYHASTTVGGDLTRQSQLLKQLMETECNPCTLVGHSYGGALALQLAVDYPQNTKAVVSLAGTVASAYQTPKWYNRLAQNSYVAFFLTHGLRASNKEMLVLAQTLDDLIPSLSRLKIPFYFMQGGDDILVDSGSPFTLLPHLNEVEVNYNSFWDHFIIWTAIPEVEELINRVNL